jgi:hypothetical protein
MQAGSNIQNFEAVSSSSLKILAEFSAVIPSNVVCQF